MKTKQAIMRLLRLTEMEYAECVEEFGYAYATYQCMGSEAAVHYLTRTAAFWRWWMRHFDIRDEIFLIEFGSYSQQQVLEDIQEMWLRNHLPSEVEGRIPRPAWQQMLEAIRIEEDAQRPSLSTNKKERAL